MCSKERPLVIDHRTDKSFSELRTETGAGTVLALAVVGLSVSMLILSQALAFNLISNLRLQATADSIAVAAADSLRGLSLGFPCDVAAEMSAANMANLVECRIVGLEVFITVHSDAVGIVLIAKARAGPSF